MYKAQIYIQDKNTYITLMKVLWEGRQLGQKKKKIILKRNHHLLLGVMTGKKKKKRFNTLLRSTVLKLGCTLDSSWEFKDTNAWATLRVPDVIDLGWDPGWFM